MNKEISILDQKQGKGEGAGSTFERLKQAHRRQPNISLAERIQVLKTIEQILLENDKEICEAISSDFGNRSFHETRILEITPSILGLRYTVKRLKKWMKPQKRHVSLLFAGGKNLVIPQAKGVIGLISPWNYPLQLTISPLTSAIAAGNRVMIKMATNSQNLCRLLETYFQEKIPQDLVTILPGVPAREFSSLPFDHMIFTGSAGVGRTIMKSAAEHLTPVTLELGGKSPTILGEDFHLKTAVERILYSKLINSGQMCVAPDYLFVPENRIDSFISLAKETVRKRYPEIESCDLTAIIDEKAFDRLLETLEDARHKGAELIKLLPGEEYNKKSRKLSPLIVRDVNDQMRIMQEEIFGPFLPVMTYKSIEDVISYINDRERPLALYIYSHNKKFQQQILTNTLSGGVTINDCTMHVAQHDLPFGGVGNSGMGVYHGYEGFMEMSKMRPVFRQSRFAISVAPPYGKAFNRIYRLIRNMRWLD